MELGDIVARNAKRRRKQLRLNQEEVAHRAGIDRTHVSKIERRVHSPTIDVLERLAFALEIDPIELLRDPIPKP